MAVIIAIISMKILNARFQRVHLQCLSVHLQRQKCSLPAQNAFVASDKYVCLQCDLYLEVTSKDYLVASDERVRL